MIRESKIRALPGGLMIVVLLALSGLSFWQLLDAALAQTLWPALVWALAFGFVLVLWFGFFIVQPNHATALQLFGRYMGTAKDAGLWWANPLYTKRRVSLRVRNFETEKLKVNDHGSNPIVIAAVVVWQVVDTAEAMFEVDDYDNYVHVQSEIRAAGARQSIPLRRARIRSGMALARSHRRSGGEAQGRDPGAAEQGRRAGARGPHQSPRLRARDRERDATAAAGRRHHRRPPPDRRWGGGDGRTGARPADRP